MKPADTQALFGKPLSTIVLAIVALGVSIPALAEADAAAGTAASAPAATAPADPVARIGELSRIRREAGLKICRDSANGKLTYQGFVQDSERDNIKVEIAAEIDKTSDQAVAGFQPVNVWDPIENWSICPK